MNWKLIFQLSLFGLAMGIATVYVIPSKIEPAFWLVIFLLCAYLIAKNSQAWHFLHGLLLGLANSVWITASHVLLFDNYIARHAQEAAMMQNSPLAVSPKMMMAIVGPVVGLISGVILGLFAFIAGKLIKSPSVPAPKATA
jgi:LytS/YehU family sensor histidine kinase